MANRRKTEASWATSTVPDDSSKVAVQLDAPVDADTAALYLTAISGFRMNADIVAITGIGHDGCTAIVNCLSNAQAQELISEINSTTNETGVTAEMHEIFEPSKAVENTWDDLYQKAAESRESHQKKIKEFESKIQQIVAGNKKGRGVEFNEFLRQQALKRPLQEKLHELELQLKEFCSYMDEIQCRLETAAQSRNWKATVTQCRTEFELELARFERSLPMYARKSDILETITNNQVCVILGETGSGKSTQILQYIHSAGFHERGIVVCTQPRKVAAVSLARRVAEEMGYQQGLVGSKVGAQSNRNFEAKLLYVTDHLLLNECLKDPLLTKYSVIIVDEAHERSIYSDLLLGFLKLALPKRNDLRVVVMSATINPDLFVSYFAETTTPGIKPPVLEVSGRAFPVDVTYEQSSEDYTKAAYRKALDLHRSEPPGDILVFLTSPVETEKACRNLMLQCGKDGAAIQALELHGKLQIEDQQKIFDTTPRGKRKIVFATNSAETSITIPGIKYVIDTGKVKELSYDPKRNMSSLNVQWVTKSSAEQRKGRAGRTDCGKCYRLYSQETYNQLREQSVPEILRIHLGQAMLKLMTLGISNPMDFDFVEAPAKDAVDSALSVLKDLGAYDENGITEVGQKLAKITLEPRLGKVVLLGIEKCIPLESAVMAAVCSVGGSIFFRGGTEEQKQQADRKKTRFCDEWGDIVTLVNVYKEWVTIPEKSRNRWCMENSINAKSMRTARDTLAEIRQTFKVELNIEIPKEEFTGTDIANEKMARILYECYFSNLSRFSGHEREGFLLANLPRIVMRVHPSSALTYIEELPTWVVYEQVLTTSETFLLNATYVKEEWVQEWITCGKLRLSLDFLSLFVLSPLPVQLVGSHCIRNLLSNKAEAKKQLEAKVKDDSEDAKCYIDIVSLEGRNGGTLTLYSTPGSQLMARSLTKSYLHDVRKSMLSECSESRLFPNSMVRLVLDRGGQIKTILMPGDSRRVKVMVVLKQAITIAITETRVRRKLSQFGEIENIRRDVPEDGVWGIVTFKLPEQAQNALNYRRHLSSTFKLETCPDTTAGRGNSEKFDYTVKVVAARRPLRGIGFVQFAGQDDASFVVDELDLCSFDIRKEHGQIRVLEDTISVSLDKKTGTQLFLRPVPMWANENLVRSSLEHALDDNDVKIANLFLPRGDVPTDSQQMLSKFQRTLKETIRDSGIIESDYVANVPEPSEKNYSFVAYLNFHDFVKARRSSDLLNKVQFNTCFMDASLLMKLSFFAPLAVNKFCAGHLPKKSKTLQKAAQGVITLQSKQCKFSLVTTVEAMCLDDLVLAREMLSPLLSGRKVELNRQQMSLVKSEAGVQQLKYVESRMRIKTHVDYRRSSVLIYASTADMAIQAERLMDELMSASMPEVSKDISLRNVEYPKGLMKALVVQYGPNLERLKLDSGIDTLDLILRQHKIRIQGGNEAYGKLMDLIKEKAKEVSECRPASLSCPSAVNSITLQLPECPVCFDSVDQEMCYVTEYCNHVYCRDCAVALVDNAMKNNEIPIPCCFGTCTETLVMHDFRNLLDGNLERLYDAAVRSFMSANGDRYSHCITPDCRMIYRRAPSGKSGEEFHCSECQVTLCTACNDVAHPDLLTCIKDREEIERWIKRDPSNRCACPKCGNGIEKDGGCMHMECTACRVHFCWHCKEQFHDEQLCYTHLRKVHGDIY